MTDDLLTRLAAAMEKVRKGLEPLNGSFAGLDPPPAPDELVTVTLRTRKEKSK